ncbi:MAG: CDP-glycerol:poly(glycerophosphate) glycerophosphotransferase [uncultured Solirubrobacteraceae bacterium]|uniref:CDP-glycerol:poly(Glycerophosphate) glycerophosphotransferase n=1 Tax=uncultured Solirubrobacteraceae bacterium TaxID=1162706 RepID=A0A6J4RGI1_9ACTN|nr:MAG: CDP-glycerol:poly(glycerophosphate) glycerophosphotransferase [uncultured Solirubrobacteraceae bacterium]
MRVVYNSFEGAFSDSPRVIFEALARGRSRDEHVWLADPRLQSTFPASVATVEYGSAESVAALEAADVVIANTHTDVPWSKRPETLYVQTWHGTPLKRIHWDVLWAPPGRLERLQEDVDRWDLLLSPNRVATPLLRRAFRYEGEVLEIGYPRNDILSAPDRESVRTRVRRRLGIPAERTVVLYAPTWRDDQVFVEGGKPFALGMDLDVFTRALGEDHVLLLRLHYMVSTPLAAELHPAIRDVSRHPDVSELYLAADVLVTDYSSVMFDFAITGKPIVLFAYDLEDYQDRLRGFYLELADEAPGPLVATTEEVVAALRERPGADDRYRERYARFRDRFSDLEDGRVTERFLEHLLPAVRARGASASDGGGRVDAGNPSPSEPDAVPARP